MDLKSRVAIVTGAGKGLGATLSRALVQEQVKTVYGIARSTDSLNDLHKELGKQFVPVTLDITKHDDVVEWMQKTFSEKYQPDILINNAGVGAFARIDEMPSELWYAMINTNLNGVYHITSETVKLMRKKNSGSHIINIGSIMGTTTRSEGTAYCATKYGINGLSQALYQEVRRDNIKVTCVNPGSIETDFLKTSGIEKHHNMLHPEDIADTIMHILKTPDNVLINELTMRPLNPKPPQD